MADSPNFQEHMKSKVEFKPTEEITAQVGNVPQGTHMDLMASFKVKEDGKWCLIAVEGVPMPGYNAQGDPDGDDSDHLDMRGGERMAERMKAAMSDGGAY